MITFSCPGVRFRNGLVILLGRPDNTNLHEIDDPRVPVLLIAPVRLHLREQA